MTMKDKIKYALAGIVAGVSNGFFGAGGGMILIPIFRKLLKKEEKRVFATSLAVVLPLSVVSATMYAQSGGFDFGSALPFVIGGTVGGFVGGKVFKKVPVRLLRITFAIFMIYGGLRLFMR